MMRKRIDITSCPIGAWYIVTRTEKIKRKGRNTKVNPLDVFIKRVIAGGSRAQPLAPITRTSYKPINFGLLTHMSIRQFKLQPPDATTGHAAGRPSERQKLVPTCDRRPTSSRPAVSRRPQRIVPCARRAPNARAHRGLSAWPGAEQAFGDAEGQRSSSTCFVGARNGKGARGLGRYGCIGVEALGAEAGRGLRL